MPNGPTISTPFSWKIPPFDLLDSPERYRILYNFGAVSLNLSTGLWALAQFVCTPTPLTTERAQAIMEQKGLGSIESPQRDGVGALRESMLALRELFLLTMEAGDVKIPPRKRFPRYFLTTNEGRAVLEFGTRKFITDDVRHMAMSLIAASLQLRDHALVGKSQDGTDAPDEQPAPMDPVGLREAILKGSTPDRAAIVEWLAKHADHYMVRFNLACYYSTELLDPANESESMVEALSSAALAQLRRALDSCPSERRAELADNAAIDPSLLELRIQAPDEFARELSSVGATWKAGRSKRNTHSTVRALQTRLLDTLIADKGRRAEVAESLIRMRAGAVGMPHVDLLDDENRYVQNLEEVFADNPDMPSSAIRPLLARVLFLPHWTGIPLRSASEEEGTGSP
jgi:hypothetical protein